MNMLDNVSLPLQVFEFGRSRNHDLARYKLGLVGLTGCESLFPSQLSEE